MLTLYSQTFANRYCQRGFKEPYRNTVVMHSMLLIIQVTKENIPLYCRSIYLYILSFLLFTFTVFHLSEEDYSLQKNNWVVNYLKNRLFSDSIEWHSRLLLHTSAVFWTLVQWIGALQKKTPSPFGLACKRQDVRWSGIAKESPGITAGRTTGSATKQKRKYTYQNWPLYWKS